MNIFNDIREHDYTQNVINTLEKEIINEDKNRLFNTDEVAYVNYLVNKYTIEPLEIYFDRVSTSTSETTVPSKKLPFEFGAYDQPGKSFLKQQITFHIPF